MCVSSYSPAVQWSTTAAASMLCAILCTGNWVRNLAKDNQYQVIFIILIVASIFIFAFGLLQTNTCVKTRQIIFTLEINIWSGTYQDKEGCHMIPPLLCSSNLTTSIKREFPIFPDCFLSSLVIYSYNSVP